LLKRFTNERVVAIVDPPRAGLRNYIFLNLKYFFDWKKKILLNFKDSKVVQALRRLENLNSIVYVSCNPDLAMQNFIE
jgi:tRNA/tmRNA/rRNA uracil-C5-methylase (TrmA/RlmC/RlmD family)